MNIHLAIEEGTITLKKNYIETAKLDSEILLANVLGSKREYIMLNAQKN